MVMVVPTPTMVSIFQGVGVTLHVGQAHARAKAQGANAVRGGGESLLHRLLDVGDAGALVREDDLDVLLGHDDVGGPAVGMDHHVDLALVHGDGDAADDVGRQAELAQVLLDLRGRLAGGREVLAVYVKVEDEGLRHGKPSL